MYKAQTDKAKNLLTIAYAQSVTADDLRPGLEKVKTLLADLKPGFRLLTDMSGLEKMDVACAPLIERVMDYCNKHGVSKIVRIIPDPRKDIGLNIMSLFHYRRGVRIVTCDTMKEALAALAE